MQKSRVFIAIPIPDETKQYISEEINKLHLSVKLIPSTNYHITVLFLGYIEDERLDELFQSLKLCINSTPLFQLTLKSVKAKSNPHHYMLWASFDFSIAFEELVTKIASSLNFPITKKPIPHINLTRSKTKINGPFPINLSKRKILVHKVELWKSILNPKGATYSSLASFNLTEVPLH